MFCEIHPDTDL